MKTGVLRSGFFVIPVAIILFSLLVYIEYDDSITIASLKSVLKSIDTTHKKFNPKDNKKEELDEIIVENSQPSKIFMDVIMMLVNNSKQQLLSLKNIEESLHQQLKISTKLEKNIKGILLYGSLEGGGKVRYEVRVSTIVKIRGIF